MRVAGTIQGAVEVFVKEVMAGTFPGTEQSF
jgi:ketopantoate hydroxymethyltransferase